MRRILACSQTCILKFLLHKYRSICWWLNLRSLAHHLFQLDFDPWSPPFDHLFRIIHGISIWNAHEVALHIYHAVLDQDRSHLKRMELLVDVQALFDILLFILAFDERILTKWILTNSWDFVAGWVLQSGAMQELVGSTVSLWWAEERWNVWFGSHWSISRFLCQEVVACFVELAGMCDAHAINLLALLGRLSKCFCS